MGEKGDILDLSELPNGIPDDIDVGALEDAAEAYDEEVENLRTKVQNKLEEFEEELGRDTTAIYLGFFQQSIYGRLVHEFHRFIRRKDKYENLAIILESGGGQLDASVKLVNICRQYSEDLEVYVPYYAKSAATVIALSADALYVGRAGELGPVDPQISHPIQDDMFIQALSIKDAVDFIEEDVSDEVIKEKLVDQLDTYWIGASQRAIDQSEEYLNDVIEEGDGNFARELVENYKDHGYPIDRSRCDDLGIPIEEEDPEIEKKLYDVHEAAVDLYEMEDLLYLMASKDDLHTEHKQPQLPDEIPEEFQKMIDNGDNVPFGPEL